MATVTGVNSFLSTGSATARLYDEACRYIPGGTSRLHYYFRPYPIYARSGEGCFLTDVEGVRRVDLLNNMTALIHGHPNGQGYIGASHSATDWTYGCIAVTDEEIEEIYALVPNGTKVHIQP